MPSLKGGNKMPNNYSPPDSVVDGTRNRNRQLMAQSLIRTPGVGDGFQGGTADPAAALHAHELYKNGLNAYLSGDQNMAVSQWQQALQMNPNDMDARQGIARLTQLTAAPPSGQSGQDYRAGLAQYLSGNDMGAAQGWQKAYAADSRNLDAKRGLQRILMKLTQEKR